MLTVLGCVFVRPLAEGMGVNSEGFLIQIVESVIELCEARADPEHLFMSEYLLLKYKK